MGRANIPWKALQMEHLANGSTVTFALLPSLKAVTI